MSFKKPVSVFHVLTLHGDTYDIPDSYVASNGKLTKFETILDIKQFLYEKYQLPIRRQRLIFAGRELLDDSTIQEANLHKHTTIHLVMLREPNSEQESAIVNYVDQLADWIKDQIDPKVSNNGGKPELLSEIDDVSSAVICSYNSMNNLADYVEQNF